MDRFRPPSDAALVLRTDRLVLRPSKPADTPLLFDACADPRLSRHMTWAPHREPGETKSFLEACSAARAAGRGWTWCVLEDGKFRGFVGIERVVREMLAGRYDRGELGYWLAVEHHGRGLMTEAAGAVVGCGFAKLKLHKVVVRAFAENAASLRVIEKLGFTRVGIARQDFFRDGAWHDHVLFEMLADEPAGARLQSLLRPAR